MINNIENLAKGEFFSVKINVCSDVDSLGCDLFTNRKYEDTITIYNDKDLNMEGKVYCTNPKITISSDKINNKNFKLTFIIDTLNLENNDVIDGEFNIITNVGELVIPFAYNIYDDTDTKLIKKLNTINDYYNLVIEDINKALLLFTSNKIYKTKMLLDSKVSSYYEMISKGTSKYISFYEFFSAFNYDIKNYMLDIDDNAFKNYLEEKNNILNNINLNDNNINNDNNADIINDKLSEIINKIIDKDLIDSMAISCVRKGYHDKNAFDIFIKALSYGSTIKNIYKAILESLPRTYDKKLPLYVYRYYFEDKSYTFEQKIALYENIITVFDENDDIYKLYYDEIKQFAISEIYKNKISETLVKLYKKILKKDIVDADNASNILYLVRNHKLITNNKKVKYVIIKYIETTNQTRYEINNGVCYLPVFFDSYIILFEDIYGNILYNVDYDFKVLFDEKEIENYCLEVNKDKNLYYFSKLIDLIEKKELSNIDINMYYEIYNNLSLTNATIANIDVKIINYLFNKTISESKVSDIELSYIKNVNFDMLNNSDKKKMMKIMLDSDNLEYVFDKICKFTINLLNEDDKIVFFEKSITTNQKYIYDIFCFILYDYVFKNNKKVLFVEFLNNYLNASSEKMFFILKISNEHNIDTQKLSTKMLKYLINSYNIKMLDDIFLYYNYKLDTSNTLLLAYLTCRSYEYFCYNKPINDIYIKYLIEYLLNYINALEDVPLIYLLSITRYISTLNVLSNNDMRRILLKSIDILLSKDLIFGYFKKLNKHVRMSDYIMDKEYIEYHTEYDFTPMAKIRINNSINEFDIELINIYKNIFVRSISVYKNEIINYKIYNNNNYDKGFLEEGTLSYNNSNGINNKISQNKNTYDYINDIITFYDDNNFNKTKQAIIDLEIKQEVTKKLFNI